MKEQVVVEPYNEQWHSWFHDVATKLRASLGDEAVRIDHIGSTSIEGLHAKPIIDIQISVRELHRIEKYKPRLEAAGYMHRADNPDLTKRYFRETPGARRTHIHVREDGSWSQQFALLFRDYLRCHPVDRDMYAREKIQLAEKYRDDRQRYVDAKDPVIWTIMQKASKWSQRVGWKPDNHYM